MSLYGQPTAKSPSPAGAVTRYGRMDNARQPGVPGRPGRNRYSGTTETLMVVTTSESIATSTG